MRSFYTPGVYDRPNHLLNFRQKSHLFWTFVFAWIFWRVLLGKVFLIAHFGSIWSRRTSRKADTSAEGTCQSESWPIRMEMEWWINSHLTVLHIFVGDHSQPPIHHPELDTLLIPNLVENIWLIPKASEKAKTEISISKSWRTRAKVMILRN